MKINLFVVVFFMLSFFKSQTTCFHTETNPISNGYFCTGNILIFTSSVDTTIKGGVYASDEILIIPSQNYSISILPSLPCVGCAGEGGTTIIPKKGGDGKGRKVDSNIPIGSTQQDEMTIEKNPVDDFLKLSLKTGLFKNIKIYNSAGQLVLNQHENGKASEVNVSKLIKGVYWLKILTLDAKTYTKQFIKK
jgi:hypothetical protein